MTIISDPNYDLADRVIQLLHVDVLMMGAEMDNLSRNLEEYDKIMIAKTTCYSTTADTWYMHKSHPRTVYYAVLINSVHEYILEKHKYISPTDEPWLQKETWKHIYDVIEKERQYLNKHVKTLKNDDVIDIDAYHNKVAGELNAVVS